MNELARGRGSICDLVRAFYELLGVGEVRLVAVRPVRPVRVEVKRDQGLPGRDLVSDLFVHHQPGAGIDDVVHRLAPGPEHHGCAPHGFSFDRGHIAISGSFEDLLPLGARQLARVPALSVHQLMKLLETLPGGEHALGFLFAFIGVRRHSTENEHVGGKRQRQGGEIGRSLTA